MHVLYISCLFCVKIECNWKMKFYVCDWEIFAKIDYTNLANYIFMFNWEWAWKNKTRDIFTQFGHKWYVLRFSTTTKTTSNSFFLNRVTKLSHFEILMILWDFFFLSQILHSLCLSLFNYNIGMNMHDK